MIFHVKKGEVVLGSIAGTSLNLSESRVGLRSQRRGSWGDPQNLANHVAGIKGTRH